MEHHETTAVNSRHVLTQDLVRTHVPVTKDILGMAKYVKVINMINFLL